MTPDREILDHLIFLYGAENAVPVYNELAGRMEVQRPRITSNQPAAVDERDAILITYGDQVQRAGEPPLRTLAEFCEKRLRGVVSGIHILPFYPYSSDDGFSVIDYRQVDPALGTWDDIARLGRSFRLMFDAVVNHVSQHSAWFQGYLKGDPRCRDFFIEVDPRTDLTHVVRPRALPLLTSFATTQGKRWVWTTFSEDQIDLNYANPRVLLEIIDLLLEYVARGASIIRLDAIAYLWKEPGGPSIHLPQTHRVVQLFRSVLDRIAPHVLLITETNVPHADNIAYFGDGRNEAQLVYNFALPPLVAHTFLTGDAAALSGWAATLKIPAPQVTFFNFLASHDGIGVNPARGLLSEEQISGLVSAAQERGGLISYKHNPDGSQSPYELNINYFDALSAPAAQDEPLSVQVSRFLASQAILLALVGLPAIYAHSLFGSRGWPEGVRQTGRSRTINRQKFDLAELDASLGEPASRRAQVFQGYRRLLAARASSAAFHPYGSQQVIEAGEGIFGLVRCSPDRQDRALCLHNVSDRPRTARLNLAACGLDPGNYRDLTGGSIVALPAQVDIPLKSYQILWLSPGEHP